MIEKYENSRIKNFIRLLFPRKKTNNPINSVEKIIIIIILYKIHRVWIKYKNEENKLEII